jgi:hypothetical protein
LLLLAVFEHEQIIDDECGIVMSVGIRGEYRQSYFLGEDLDRLLTFVFTGRCRRRRLREYATTGGGQE